MISAPVFGLSSVLVGALAGDIALCSCARHFTMTVPLSKRVYEWVPANLMMDVTLRWTFTIQAGIGIRLVASCYGNWDKLWPDRPLNWLVCRLYPPSLHQYYCYQS